MRRSGILAATFVVLAAAAPAAATSPEDISARASELPASELAADEWPFETLPPALQEALRRAALDADVEGAVGDLADRLDGDLSAARSILGATFEVLIDLFPTCDQARVIALGEPIERELLDAVVRHPGSEEVIAAAGLFYDQWAACLPGQGAHLVERVADTPAGAEAALRVARLLDGHDRLRQELLAAAASTSGSTLPVLEAMVDSVSTGPRRAALLERAAAVAARTAPERRPDFVQRQIAELLAIGDADAALAVFETVPDAMRRSILDGGGRSEGEDDLRLDLAAAAAVEGDVVAARAILSAAAGDHRDVQPAAPDAGYEERERAEHASAEALLWEALELLLAERAALGDPFELLAELALADDGVEGRCAALQALSELAASERYQGFTRYFHDRFERDVEWEAEVSDESSTPSDDPFRTGFPEAARRASALSERLQRRVEVRRGWLGLSAASEGTSAILGRLDRPRLEPFRERPLPEDLETGYRADFQPPEALPLPEGLGLLRAEREDDDAVAVGLAQALDPTGEVSGGGYWIARSTDGGASWRLLYTGLRAYRPYEVVERSALPLRAPGGVRVEVWLTELDESSITFPPIGLEITREADRLYLEIPWRELERDGDGDGLTDLVEERLLTDPADADSDGDGVRDGEDPLPRVAFAGRTSPATEALAALLVEIAGEEARAILPRCADGESMCFGRSFPGAGRTHFVVGDREAWAGLAPAQRTIVLTEAELEAAKEKFGLLFATRFPLFELDRQRERAVVIWSRSWTGGAALLHRSEDGWEVMIRSWWIT